MCLIISSSIPVCFKLWPEHRIVPPTDCGGEFIQEPYIIAVLLWFVNMEALPTLHSGRKKKEVAIQIRGESAEKEMIGVVDVEWEGKIVSPLLFMH